MMNSPHRNAPAASSTWKPLFAMNCLKSANLRSPTRTDLWGGGVADGGSRTSFSSAFPTSASTEAISCSPNFLAMLLLIKSSESITL
uniref:Uncharacterized protein n=1 Tax=Arundo donax TaxID=35708 RepID=A0A0A9FTB4_ARUDO